ncbi:MAG: S8 family serine peptidase, partial [Planctomycetota bacterium]
MSKAARRKTAARRTQIESLEDRMLMAFDALDGLLGGLVSQHGAIDEGPDFVQPHVVDQPPTLAHHSGGHGLVHHGPAEHGLMHHDTPDGLPPVSHQAERSADFWLDPVGDLTGGIETTLGEIEQTLSSAHGQTGLNNVRTDYGFTGGGQTVAVIDSGIAYDHYALGGGFGANYRVVGGYDFTGGQDSDPYDGGPGGSHGTHVAGIVGSSDSTHQGVAPDVDLVGLRVFDDNGNGYFSWVENALQWVIDHRESFENPITAVNLSLGTSWNSESIPSWAMLEEEFAQLEAAGVFISVSAGNSFTSYGTPGLSYPAASPHVVPVMSTDDSGMLSYFSQRSQSAIAAPGRYIYSTVPDYAGNNNGVTDDWANFSGTSMAAPYVAGASVLVREAMQFVAMTGINQDTIYNHMLATADSVYDSSTGLSYSRLNVEAAIDALMPVDDYGSTEATAYDLGQITGTLAGPSQASSSVMQMNGVISTLDDTDYFTFTAGSTGTVTFTASGATHDLDASWQGFGGEGWSHASGDAYTMHVIAGQQYSVAISSTDGLGYYNLDVSAEAAFTFTDWGALAGQQTYTGLESSGANWYRFVVGQDGYVTLDPGAGSTGDLAAISVSLHDANQNAIGAQNGAFRIDHYATAGDELYVRVDGDASQIGIRLTNLVSVAGAAVTVAGTSAADDLAFAAGSGSHTVTVNGLAYSFDSTQHTSFSLAGGGGADVVTLTGGAGDDTAWLGGAASLTGAGYSATATGYARVNAYGGAGGNDTLNFQDTSGDDVVALRPGQNDAYMAGGGVFAYAYGFDRVNAYATAGGYDRVDFQDTAGDDSVTFRPQENDA